MFQLISKIKIVEQPKHFYLLFTTKKCIYTTQNVNKDYYAVLNIERNSTRKNIKHAYYKLSKLYHPDVNKEPEAEAKFKEIQEAYNILGDEARKSEYDSTINQGYYERGNASQRYPFDRSQRRSGPARTTTNSSTAYDFSDYYRSDYNDKYKSKSYSSYASANSSSPKMSQEELNRYWNKQEFGSHNEIRDAYKRLSYSLILGLTVVLFIFNISNQALNREKKMAFERANDRKT